MNLRKKIKKNETKKKEKRKEEIDFKNWEFGEGETRKQNMGRLYSEQQEETKEKTYES